MSLCLAKPGLAGDDALALCEMVIEHAGLGAALASYILPDGHEHDGDEGHPPRRGERAPRAGCCRGLTQP